MLMDGKGDGTSPQNSGRRLATAIGLAAAILVLIGLAGPTVDLSRSAGCGPASTCTDTETTTETTTDTINFYTVTVGITGQGQVKSGARTCPSNCTWTVAEGSSITFTGTPSSGWGGPTWSGCDSGGCTVTVNADRTV